MQEMHARLGALGHVATLAKSHQVKPTGDVVADESQWEHLVR
jgi:hypothetical protein